jgi:integrase
MLPQGVHPHRWKQRLDAARGFARYLAASDPEAEVPPAGLLDARPNRHRPYIFTGREVAALMTAAGQHRWHLPAVTYPALFGLIAATGMRLGEAVRLDDADADLDEAMITIRDSKYGKSRRIPVDATVTAALRDYLDKRRVLRPAPKAPALFLSAYGTRLITHHANAEFRRITAATGIGANAVNPPRIHDLRHSMAVRTLAGWYRDGGDVAARMPLLSAYLGHVSPVSTYWYLHSVPELLALAAQRLENAEAAS